MKTSPAQSRRLFLQAALRTARNSALTLTLPSILAACARSSQARLDNAGFKNLGDREALELESIASRIIPSDETPGAREAGVIYFIDNVIGDQPQALELLRSGLRDLQSSARARYGSAEFHNLLASQQDSLLGEIEQTPFFDTLRFLTIAGMFSLPEYGGNRDNLGYQLIGFDDRHVWAPPFGFYDADYRQRGE